MPVETVEPGGGIFERSARADQVVDSNVAAGHQVDTLGVFAGGGAGALQADPAHMLEPLPAFLLLARRRELSARRT